MAENMNFDPGARSAATAGLRGAYDGSGGIGPTGPGLGDLWGYEGAEGWSPFQHGQWSGTVYSPADLSGMLLAQGTLGVDGTTYMPEYRLPGDFNLAFENAGLKDNVKFDRTTGQSTWTGPGTAEQAIADAFGQDGLQYQTYINSGGNRGLYGLVDRNGQMRGGGERDLSDGFLESYMPAATVGIIGGIAGGVGAGMAGGGAGGAAVGGAASGAITSGVSGGNILEGAALGGLTGYLGSGVNVGQAVGAGEYADLVNKLTRGGLQGALTGGGAGALRGMGMAGLNQGLGSMFGGDTTATTATFDGTGTGGGADTMQMSNWGLGDSGSDLFDMASWGQGASGSDQFDAPVMGGGQLSSEQQPAMKMSDWGLGSMGSDTFDMPSTGGDMTGSAGTSWDDEFKKFSSSPLARGGMRAFAALNPKYGQLMGAMGMLPQGKMSGIEAGLGALGTLYANHRQNKAIKSQQQQLRDLFSPNSAYSKEMRQQLERKDAAAGRRSQYGPREAQLAAMLTQQNAQLQPYMGQLDQMRSNSRNQLLRDLMIYGNRSGATEWLGNQMSDGLRGLQGMFQG